MACIIYHRRIAAPVLNVHYDIRYKAGSIIMTCPIYWVYEIHLYQSVGDSG